MKRGTLTLATGLSCVVLAAVGLAEWTPFTEFPAPEGSRLEASDPNIIREPVTAWAPPSAADAKAAGIVDLESALFWRAMAFRDRGTALVLVTVIDERTRQSQTACVAVSELLTAIVLERRLLSSDLSFTRAEQIAFDTPGRAFSFRDPAALAIVARKYSDDVLVAARKDVAARTQEELLADLGPFWGPPRTNLVDFYESHDEPEKTAYVRALAHALLERGVLPGEWPYHSRYQGRLQVAE